MKFSYPEGLAHCEVQGRGATIPDTKLSARDLLRTVVELCQGLALLPETLHLSMKLLYYEEVTPEDYEPIGFKATEFVVPRLPAGCQKFAAGRVSTAHHSLKVKVLAVPLENTVGVVNDQYVFS